MRREACPGASEPQLMILGLTVGQSLISGMAAQNIYADFAEGTARDAPSRMSETNTKLLGGMFSAAWVPYDSPFQGAYPEAEKAEI